jgi:hypothetical protein
MADVPPSIPGFSEPIRCHRASRAGLQESVLWGCGPTLVALIGLVVGVGGLFFYGWSGLFLIGLSIIPLGIGGLFLWQLVLLLMRRFWLFPEGIADCCGSWMETCRWDEVEEFVYYPFITDLALRKADGTQLDFGPLTIEDAGELAEEIVERLVKIMAARLSKKIQAGKTVSFGRIEANQAGITIFFRAHKSKKPHSFYKGPWPKSEDYAAGAKRNTEDVLHFSWNQVQAIQQSFQFGTELVTPEESVPLWCALADVPNAYVLPAIAQRLLAKKT